MDGATRPQTSCKGDHELGVTVRSAREPIRVVHVLHQLTSGLGGAEVFTVDLVHELRRREVDARLAVTRSAPTAVAEELADRDIPFFAVGRTGRREVHKFRRFISYLRRERVTLVHGHMFGSNLWATLCAKAAGVPATVVHEHAWAFQRWSPRSIVDRTLIAPLADRFVAVSDWVASGLVEVERIPRERVVVIPAGRRLADPLPRSRAREELGLAASDLVIGTVAVMRREKALDKLVQAVAMLRASTNVKLVLVGDGPERQRIVQAARAAGVADHTWFAGARPDAARLVSAFDVAALSSDFEGSPLFVIEAMAAGVPVVAPAVGGIPELASDAAVLAPDNSPEALCAALERVVGDRRLRETLGQRGKQRAHRYEIGRVAREIHALYEEILARRCRR